MGRRVLITGVSGFWGTKLARRLERDPEFEYIAGLDVRPPAADLTRTEFIRADIRNPLLTKLLPRTEVDTVVHCDVLLVPEPGKAPSQLHDINVIGSLQLLAACEKTESVRTIVVRGSAAIYGAEPNAPEFFTEDMARRFPLRTQFQRDVGELENYFENFARRFPQVTVMMLRYQPTLGMAIDSPLTRYLQQSFVPTQLGYDPLLQFVHAEDAVSALEASVRRPVRGPVNVAGEGSMSLSRMLRLAGRVPLPVPGQLFGAALGAGARLGLARLPPEAVLWLRNGLTVDTGRLIHEVGFRPRSTADAVDDFVAELRGSRALPGRPVAVASA
jgi:UDP-glucose 4-epimerase